jgi:adenine/guanine phosphoribosyltransferase-like PRPP-binding protein
MSNQKETFSDKPEILQSHEINVPSERIMWHCLRFGEVLPDSVRYSVIPASKPEPPLYNDGFYPANVGTPENPLMLELRLEPIPLHVHTLMPDYPVQTDDDRVRIALLMTNERDPAKDLRLLGSEMLRRVDERGIEFDAIIAPEALGSKLSIAIAQAAYDHSEGERHLYATSLQKGKVRMNPDGTIVVGPPKEWIGDDDCVETSSGTSHPAARQKLFLDPRIGKVISDHHLRVLLVDDARLTQGTITASLELLKCKGIEVTGIATVLNEGDAVDTINGIPFVYLTKLPLFAPVPGGMRPIPGTYDGLQSFFVRT